MSITSDKNQGLSPEALLSRFFHRNGYIRVPNKELRRKLKNKYKKGYEVRLVANDESELEQIRSLLRQAGFRSGKPYKRGYGQQIIQPIYGKESLERFLAFSSKSDEQ